MTTAQVFQESLRTTAFGMSLVIATLFLLSYILQLMKIIVVPGKKKDDKIKKGTDTVEPSISQTSAQADDTQLIAVITAAIQEYTKTPLTNVKIHAIRKLHEKTPIWGMASRMYNIDNKL